MAELTVRKETIPQIPSVLPTIFQQPEIAPFRMLNDMMRWEPFRELSSLLRYDPFTTMAPLLPQVPIAFVPAFEVKETVNSYLFKADVPGVNEKDIDISVVGNRLTISGIRNEEKEEKTETWFSAERRYGSFSRSYTLPEGADLDHVQADLKGGVLTVAVGKKPGTQPRKISVKTT